MSILKKMSDYDKVYPELREFKMMSPFVLAEAEFVKKKGLIVDPNKDKPGMQYKPTGYFIVVKLPETDVIDTVTNDTSKLKLQALKLGDRIAVAGVSMDPNDYSNHIWTWGDLSKKDKNSMDEEPLTVLIGPDNVIGVVGKIPE